jgi:ankyrin repeat protein
MLYRVHRQNQLNLALWKAVEIGNLLDVTLLLDRGADPNTNEYQVLDSQHGKGIAALMTRLFGRKPSYNLDPTTSKWTADPRVPGNWTQRQKWNSALWLATENERPDIVRTLVAKGAKDQATGYLNTALMWATARGHRDIVKSLLAGGSDVNAANDFGDTALDGAVMRGDIEIVKLLLQHGADINRSDALALAKARGQQEIVDLIERFRSGNKTFSASAMP